MHAFLVVDLRASTDTKRERDYLSGSFFTGPQSRFGDASIGTGAVRMSNKLCAFESSVPVIGKFGVARRRPLVLHRGLLRSSGLVKSLSTGLLSASRCHMIVPFVWLLAVVGIDSFVSVASGESWSPDSDSIVQTVSTSGAE